MDLILVFILGIVGMCIGGFVGLLIGQSKGRRDQGALLGAVLGPIGWVIVACLQDRPTGVPMQKVARRGGEWPAFTRPAAQPGGIKVRCPNCGEVGYVPEVTTDSRILCPLCQEKFDGAPNVAKG